MYLYTRYSHISRLIQSTAISCTDRHCWWLCHHRRVHWEISSVFFPVKFPKERKGIGSIDLKDNLKQYCKQATGTWKKTVSISLSFHLFFGLFLHGTPHDFNKRSLTSSSRAAPNLSVCSRSFSMEHGKNSDMHFLHFIPVVWCVSFFFVVMLWEISTDDCLKQGV